MREIIMRTVNVLKVQPVFTMAGGIEIPVLEIVNVAGSIPEAADWIASQCSWDVPASTYFICEVDA